MRGIDVARTKLGLEEARDKKALMEFFKKHAIKGDIELDPSKLPWCAAFVNACEREAGNKGTGKLNARSFLEYGTKVELKDIKEGDILIFKRGTGAAATWQGHVTYFVGFQSGTRNAVCLGGNQNNRVCEALYSLDSLLGIRRP